MHLAAPEAVLAVDEMGFVKKDTKLAGWQPNIVRRSARLPIVRSACVLTYSNRFGADLLGRELYLPAGWVKDPKRWQEAEVPEERRKTMKKPTLAKQMLERAFAHEIKAAWATGEYRLWWGLHTP